MNDALDQAAEERRQTEAQFENEKGKLIVILMMLEILVEEHQIVMSA